ncbi:hypothetical protein [Aulosira sp. FACHB-615]|uniref:hypothetical protein n=1 Tax=Aulosira sp. FACHB-615 TaxID=2692777 RepID=UPI0016871AF2|nr:hypothetical protein [Aulosira sp. FACHB-615]MBD2487172.1 hypothetical protein [Aulosira sp. FACHB-615]
MWISKVPKDELENRIDCHFYQPDAIAEIKKIKNFPCKPLSYYVVEKRSEPPIHTSHYAEQGIHIISPSNFTDFVISLEDTYKVNPSYIDLFKDFILKEGNIIYALVGDVGHACVVPIPAPKAITYRRTANISLKGINPYFVCAFLNYRAGDLQLKRMTTGVIQSQLRLEDSIEVLIPSWSSEIQTYIGDKVRLAEILRERSRHLEEESRDKFNSYFGFFKALPLAKFFKTESLILENRIDTWFYNPRFLNAVKAIQEAGAKLIPLGKLAKRITNGGTPANALFTEKGIPWIRGKDFEHGDIAVELLPLMDFASEESIKRSRLKVGGIILSIKGTVGDVAVVDELLVGCNINQDIALIEINNLQTSHFIAAFLESELGQILIEQQVYGAINPFFSLENLRLFSVPDPNSVDQNFKMQLANLRHTRVRCKRLSQLLTTTAKLLVEALIEGKLTEDELKIAQEALQKGDREPDKAILSRLTCKGYDIKDEPPLFPDLDLLYQTIDQLNADEQSE